MNYQEFKDHLAEFLWKETDDVLLAKLDTLITMGEHSLNSALHTKEQKLLAQIHPPASTFTLPCDITRLRSISTHLGEHHYVPPAYVLELREHDPKTLHRVYSVQGSQILMCGPFEAQASINDRICVIIAYSGKVPVFKLANTSWLADNHLDLYTYAVLKHAAVFVREDERIPTWTSLYAEALEQVNENFAFNQEISASYDIPLPYPASPTSKKRYTR